MQSRREFLAGTVGALAVSGAALAEEKKLPGKTKHTRFAVNVEMWWPRERNFLKRLENAAELGFSAVEFWPFENKDIPAVARTCQRLKLDVAQFTAWGFKPGLNDPNNHEAFVKKIRQACVAAKQLNCKLMTVVAGDDIKGKTQKEMHAAVIEGLKKAVPIVEKEDITLILEPMNIKVDHKGHCLYGSAPAIAICQAVGSKHVKINWDLYHMYITEQNLIENLRKGWEWVGYLQIADHPGRNEPGTGEIDYTSIFKEIQKLKYPGYVGLELRPKKSEEAAAWAVNRADDW